MIPISYIGKRETYTENCYGSGIVFTKDIPVMIPDYLGHKLLKHPEFKKEATGIAIDIPEPVEEEPNSIRDDVTNMSKQALIDFAEINFSGYKIDKRKSEGAIRDEVIRLIDQYNTP